LEYLFNNLGSYLLELLVRVLDELQSGISQLFELRVDQVNENVDGRESWKTVTFVHLDGLLDVHVVVLRTCAEAVELLVQVVEVHFDFRSS
jgi:hypothetical protein